MQEEPILIVTTGGTIDKTYFDRLSQFQVGSASVRRVLEVARVDHPTCIVELLRKDSLDMTDDDRRTIIEFIATTQATRIVITHGTDTMADTARSLSQFPGKTIVLTGAFTPAKFAESDAPFNVGMAIATAQLQPPGVYIAINGRVFPGGQAEKSRTLMRFVQTQ